MSIKNLSVKKLKKIKGGVSTFGRQTCSTTCEKLVNGTNKCVTQKKG